MRRHFFTVGLWTTQVIPAETVPPNVLKRSPQCAETVPVDVLKRSPLSIEVKIALLVVRAPRAVNKCAAALTPRVERWPGREILPSRSRASLPAPNRQAPTALERSHKPRCARQGPHCRPLSALAGRFTPLGYEQGGATGRRPWPPPCLKAEEQEEPCCTHC